MKNPAAVLFCAFLLGGCLSVIAAETPASSGAAASVSAPGSGAPGADEQNKKIYYFEHRFIPKFVHHSEGKLFEDLIAHDGKVIRQAAAEFVGKSFAAQLELKTIEPGKAVLITFATPTRPLQCFYAIVAKTDSGYAYITLEKAMNLTASDNVKAMYCGWSADGVHQNFGPRDYDSAEAFVKEFLSNPPTTPQASSRPKN